MGLPVSLRDHCASYAIRQDYCAKLALPLIFLMPGIAGVHRINIITQGVIGVHRHSFWPTQISENSSPVQSVCVFEYAIVNRGCDTRQEQCAKLTLILCCCFKLGVSITVAHYPLRIASASLSLSHMHIGMEMEIAHAHQNGNGIG